MSTHLIMGDPHARPGVSNRRFLWAGRLAADLKPDVIIQIGDLADMNSLNSYDKGKGSFMGRRYQSDIQSANEALTLFDEGYNSRARRNKKRTSGAQMVSFIGNHEERINRAISEDPTTLEGTIGTGDIEFKKYGWEVVPYEGGTPGVSIIDGIAYAHYHTSGVMGRPIGGEHPAYSLLNKKYMSCVAGHLHLFDYAERTRADRKHIQSIICGCYLDDAQFEEYAGSSNWMWWRGLIVLKHVNDGQFDFERVSFSRIKREYRCRSDS